MPGYAVSYAVSYYDATTGRESPRSAWWGPKTDPKRLYGGFGLIHECPDNVTTKYRDDVL